MHGRVITSHMRQWMLSVIHPLLLLKFRMNGYCLDGPRSELAFANSDRGPSRQYLFITYLVLLLLCGHFVEVWHSKYLTIMETALFRIVSCVIRWIVARVYMECMGNSNQFKSNHYISNINHLLYVLEAFYSIFVLLCSELLLQGIRTGAYLYIWLTGPLTPGFAIGSYIQRDLLYSQMIHRITWIIPHVYMISWCCGVCSFLHIESGLFSVSYDGCDCIR